MSHAFHLKNDVFLLLFSECGALGVDAGVSMRGGHEELWSLDDVILFRVVLEENVVAVLPWPVLYAVQDLLMVLKSPLCKVKRPELTKLLLQCYNNL